MNGRITSFIPLELRGLRQGCPLSMRLYVIAAETTAINTRCNAGIHGILTPESQEEVKLSQFADDTTLLLLLVDENSTGETFRTFDLYGKASGAKINKTKCKDLLSGAFVHRTDRSYGLEWFNQYIPEKILEQYFGNVDCTQLNWNHKVEKIKNIVTSWQHRDLSYKGRALLINALMTSTLWYN